MIILTPSTFVKYGSESKKSTFQQAEFKSVIGWFRLANDNHR
uniref:Transposase n=1 Tax=Mesocestoides corti TaxID=53468 RepID=A0A5K3FMA2_MESCO